LDFSSPLKEEEKPNAFSMQFNFYKSKGKNYIPKRWSARGSFKKLKKYK